MRKAAIVAVGTELLFGTTINTNAAYISERLHELGIGVIAHYVTGDNPRRLMRTLEIAFEEADIVVVSGGLGPTQDDLTKEIIAEHLGVELVLDDEAKQRLDGIMHRYGIRNYTPNNVKQAYMPAGCTPFYNTAGTAPGFALKQGGRLVIAVPGPPREMKQMMLESVIPYLRRLSDKTIHSQMLRFYRIGESALETALLPIIDGQTDPTVAPYAKDGECMVRITSMRDDAKEAKEAVADMVARAKELVGEYLYSDRGQDYVEVVVERLLAVGMRLAVAEAYTDGYFAHAIASVPGAREVFDRCSVACGDKALTEMLDVAPQLLGEYGAVSVECCKAMALGALNRSHADVAVAVTGVDLPRQAGDERSDFQAVFGFALRDPHTGETRCEAYERTLISRGRQANCQVCTLELCSLIDAKLKEPAG